LIDQDLNSDLELAIKTVKAAGELILKYFRGAHEVREKGRNNPVTSADLAADSHLREAIARAFPDDGWLSEETADSPHRLDRKRVWVVDPMDGTKEFVQGLPEFAVSVALVEQEKPRLAVVYNPARDDLFAAKAGSGAFRGNSRLQISERRVLQQAHVLGSRSEATQKLLDPLREWGTVQTIGSIAYKLALVAAQDGDITVSFRPKNEWDICAGSLLVSEAGGIVTDLRGNSLRFNQPKTLVHGIIAANPTLHSHALQWIRERPELLRGS
jgi:myo-inositol-1(or 4)-monophosphatase